MFDFLFSTTLEKGSTIDEFCKSLETVLNLDSNRENRITELFKLIIGPNMQSYTIKEGFRDNIYVDVKLRAMRNLTCSEASLLIPTSLSFSLGKNQFMIFDASCAPINEQNPDKPMTWYFVHTNPYNEPRGEMSVAYHERVTRLSSTGVSYPNDYLNLSDIQEPLAKGILKKG